MFRNRLSKVHRRLSKLARKKKISCYRVYDHDLPEFPICIEIYGENLYIAEYKRQHGMTENEHNLWMEKTLLASAEVMATNKDNIFLKLRQRKPGRLGQYQKIEEGGNEFTVDENGLSFIVNLNDYLDTGLFLDHRDTREMVREKAKDKRVLNLFSYTGSFSVYAASGKATEVESVDLSRTYLSWSERNMKLNGFEDQEKFRYIQADVKQYLRELPDASFDLIILDPPTFSNSKRMDDFLDIQKDHVSLINECLRILSSGGEIIFSTNYRKFQLEKKNITSANIKDITKATTPFDFEGKLGRVCFKIGK